MITALLLMICDYDGIVTDPRPQITCGHCRLTHHSAAAVRACHRGDRIAACSDLVQIATEDGPSVAECGHEAIYTTTGFSCDAGHEYTDMATREAAGWDYAGDAYDAAVLIRGGRDYVPMGPATVIDDRDVARLAAAL